MLFGWTGLLVAAAVAIFFNNALIDWLPIDSAPLKWVVGLTNFAFVAIASGRYWQAYRSTNFPLQSGLAHVALLVGAAQLIAITGTLWHISWWLYHFILLFAVLATVFSLVRQFSFGETLSLAMQGLFCWTCQTAWKRGSLPRCRH